MVTKKQCEEIFQWCKKILLDPRLNIKVEELENLKGYYIQLGRAKVMAGSCHFSPTKIVISSKCIHNFTDMGLRNTVLHEVIHAITPREKHGGRWLEIATAYNKCEDLVLFTGKISQYYHSTYEERYARCNWVLECPDCGRVFFRIRRPSEAMVHKGCKSSLKLIRKEEYEHGTDKDFRCSVQPE